ncbi:MAG TPA: YhbY family RNA-binding protein [Candidatus Nanoarchaeia archaeon]|nr:YhbY family RNA-binding protein [Candidatus Nanoarchaeia archaeon]
MPALTQSQIGKNGVTPNFIETLKTYFKKHDIVKISVLKSGGHEKAKVKEYSNTILNALGDHYTSKIIGFTIIVRKWRKARR